MVNLSQKIEFLGRTIVEVEVLLINIKKIMKKPLAFVLLLSFLGIFLIHAQANACGGYYYMGYYYSSSCNYGYGSTSYSPPIITSSGVPYSYYYPNYYSYSYYPYSNYYSTPVTYSYSYGTSYYGYQNYYGGNPYYGYSSYPYSNYYCTGYSC